MSDPGTDLRSALVEAYRPHVERRVQELGLDWADDLEAATVEGERWLSEQLGELFGLPFAEQRRGPLELFQEAMRPPTHALAARGVDPVQRDEVAESAIPGDVYDLAPSSSVVLGEETWRAHLAWGAVKARSMLEE